MTSDIVLVWIAVALGAVVVVYILTNRWTER